ncbi:MAG TPA: hypothetical protein VI757_09225 [Bacteroidia bacterium]|nr:hypothetical protein [Bacteroidia bacterium]
MSYMIQFGEERELPLYLGYGTLKEPSICFENNILTADYEMDGQRVHSVVWKGTHCEVHTYFEGRHIRSCLQPSLSDAVCTDFAGLKLWSDKCFSALWDKVREQRNILFEWPSEKSTSYKHNTAVYPAGKMFTIMCTVTGIEDSAHFRRFIDNIPLTKSLPLQLDNVLPGMLLLADRDFRITSVPVNFVWLRIPLAFLRQSVQLMEKENLLGTKRYLRPRIFDMECFKTSHLSSIIGDHDFPYYCTCYGEHITQENFSSSLDYFTKHIREFEEEAEKKNAASK